MLSFKDINGLYLFPEVFTPEEDAYYMNILNSDNTANICKQIHTATEYGWKFIPVRDDKSKIIKRTPEDYLGEFPEWLFKIWHKIRDNIKNIPEKDFSDVIPDHTLINKYNPGDGCRTHTDDKDFWENWVIGVSFGSGCTMSFGNNSISNHSFYIPPRSVYIMIDEARYKWTHGISFENKDIVYGDNIERTQRISITFRTIKKEYLP